MATVSFGSAEFHTTGELPAVGSQAPDFKLVDNTLTDVGLAKFAGKKKLLNIVPSLDTPVCGLSTMKFSNYAKKHPDTVVLVISADLPFAQGRFCSSNQDLDNIETLSMMRSRDFARDYGILLADGPMAGITSRAVMVLDEDDKVVYGQLVPVIGEEPDYDAALKALG